MELKVVLLKNSVFLIIKSKTDFNKIKKETRLYKKKFINILF